MPDVRVIYSSKGASIQKIQTVQNILIERNSDGQYFRGTPVIAFCTYKFCRVKVLSNSALIRRKLYISAEFTAGLAIPIIEFHTYMFRRDFA